MKALAISALVCSCMLAPEVSDAGQLTTGFNTKVYVGSTLIMNTPNSTSEGKRITLPVALDDWNCEITETHIADDGKTYYRNVVCTDTRSRTVVGVSASCPVNTTGIDVSQFFLRIAEVNVEFSLSCATIQVGSSAQPAHEISRVL